MTFFLRDRHGQTGDLTASGRGNIPELTSIRIGQNTSRFFTVPRRERGGKKVTAGRGGVFLCMARGKPRIVTDRISTTRGKREAGRSKKRLSSTRGCLLGRRAPRKNDRTGPGVYVFGASFGRDKRNSGRTYGVWRPLSGVTAWSGKCRGGSDGRFGWAPYHNGNWRG